ncbi:MAG: hypothetical protein FWF67_07530 [Fibromonadales bacterium]|nr:hypothetical protein [Fibromonadales bacterium]
MKKSTLMPVILTISMMVFPSSANAFWLDIVKEFVSGGIKTIVIPKAAKGLNTSAENKPAPSPASVQAPRSGAQYTPEEIFAALGKLEEICGQEFVRHIPCAVGTGENFSIGDAREEAIAKARVELAKNMGTYVEAQAKLESSKSKNQGILTVTNSYISNATLTTEQFVIGAQQYLSYTYIDEKLSEINGQRVYVTTVVMVMNSELFEKALEYEAKGKPLSEQIINESKKGIVAIAERLVNKIAKK